MNHLFPYPKMGHSFLEILEDPLTRKLLGHDAVHAEKTPFIGGVSSRLTFLLHDQTKHLSFLKVGYSALEAFLQANCTGPPLEFDSEPVVFPEVYRDDGLPVLKEEIMRSLSVDGDDVYALTPRIELFWLAKTVMANSVLAEEGFNGRRARFRVNFWHQKLLLQKSDALQALIYQDAEILEQQLSSRLSFGGASAEEHMVEFLVERAVVRTYYDDEVKARDDLTRAARTRHFEFALTGAMGKRTKHQHKDTSQLVVVAKSRDFEPDPYSSRKSSRADISSRKSSAADASGRTPSFTALKRPATPVHGTSSPSALSLALKHEMKQEIKHDAKHELDRDSSSSPKAQTPLPEGDSPKTGAARPERGQPETIPLNDDTLLEQIKFQSSQDSTEVMEETNLPLPLAMVDITDQPLLFPMDSIILLTLSSTITNTQASDGLTREETLPYATRVLEGGSSNWQVYTQALLVRSRIEGYRSRTAERGLLQLQALVDQIVLETTGSGVKTRTDGEADPHSQAPTSFLPKVAAEDSASVAERLKYIHQLSPPYRWELEAELANRWVTMGGLRTALEIYDRLQMKAEVALCLAATDQEPQAVKIVKDLLFADPDQEMEDGSTVVMKTPPPADASRLLCILGDILAEPKYYNLSWTVSGERYARAQRSLGRFYLQRRDYPAAAGAFRLSLGIARLDHATWFALGCVYLELSEWSEAVESFKRVVHLEDRDAEAWSNLAVALLRLPPPDAIVDDPTSVPTTGSHVSTIREDREAEAEADGRKDEDEDEAEETPPVDPLQHTREAMRALKRAANIKREDARIWDNYLTVVASIPPSSDPDKSTPWNEVVLAMSQTIHLRHKKEGENCIDLKILRVLVDHVTSSYNHSLTEVTADHQSTTPPAPAPPFKGREETPPMSPHQEPDRELDFSPSTSRPQSRSRTRSHYEPDQNHRLPYLARAVIRLVDTQIIPIASANGELYLIISDFARWRQRPHEALSFVEKAWRATTNASAGHFFQPTAPKGSSLSLSSSSSLQHSPSSSSATSAYETEAGWNEIVAKTTALVHAYRDLGQSERERTGGTVEKSWRFKARTAIRGVLGRGKELWGHTEGYGALEKEMAMLKN